MSADGEARGAGIAAELPAIVREFLAPLYERFDGVELTLRLVDEQVEELKRVGMQF
jgi:hypothetical protein